MRLRRALPGAPVAAALMTGPVAAQRVADATPAQPEAASPAGRSVLVLDTDRLFTESRFGQRIAKQIQAETEALIEENRRIEAQLTEEERSLTERRPSMAPAAFRAEAEAFDSKVQEIRREQDAKERALQQSTVTGRERFLSAAAPTLGRVMLSRNASVILDQRGVFLSVAAADITDAAIAALDEEVGDGSDLDLSKPAETPAPVEVPKILVDPEQ